MARVPAPATAALRTPPAIAPATTLVIARAMAAATVRATRPVTAPATRGAPAHRAMAAQAMAAQAPAVQATPLGHHTDPRRAATGVPQLTPLTAAEAVDVRDEWGTGGESVRGWDREGPSRVGSVLPKEQPHGFEAVLG